jgi:hypothetical protein
VVFDFFGNNDDEQGEPITQDQLERLYAALETTAETIEQRRLKIEDRVTLSKQVGSLLGRVHDATVESAEPQWYSPDTNPTTDEIAEDVRDLISFITFDRLTDSADKQDILDMQSDLGGIQNAVDAMEEFDYAYVEEDRNTMYGEEIQSIGLPDDVDPDELEPGQDGREIYAAGSARRVLEEVPREYNDAPLFVGKGTRNGRDASIDKNHLFRHRAIFGVTGYGKSTLLTNDARQLIESGAGLCFIDPKGDDSRRLMQIMPEHRIDDVVWIEPGATGDYLSGFNFISLNMEPDNDEYQAALASLVADLKKMLSANDDYWGPRMDRVAGSIITAMNRYNTMTPDDAPDMNFVDMYYVLKSEASRHEFTARIKEAGMRFITPHMETVAKLPEDDLEPLLGRFLPWIQNPVARRMIGFRSGGVNIPDAIDNNKIIIVRMGSEPRELKQMLGMAVIRRIWSHIRARAMESEHERSPFYLFADEFDNLALADDTIPAMISESRSYRLAMTLANQYPAQLPSNVIDAITTNCDTIMSFNPGDKKSARTYCTQLGLEPDDLTEEVNYHYWMRTTISENMERSEAFRVYAHPPFPPVRDTDARDAAINASLRKVGRERRSDEQVYQNLLFNEGGGRWETGVGRDIARADDRDEKLFYAQELQSRVPGPENPGIGDEVDTSVASPSEGGEVYGASTADDAESVVERHLDTVLESVFAARLRAGLPAGEYVPTADAKDELVARLEDSTVDSLSELSNIYERVNSTYAKTKREGGESVISLTPKGRGVVLEQDTGSAGSGGGDDHRWILGQCYVAFTQIGYVTWLPEQEGEEMPDGAAKTPIDLDTDGLSGNKAIEAVNEMEDTLREEYPGVWNFAGANDVSIEAETSTIKYPFQTFTNLRKAMEKDEKCVFAVKDGSAKHGRFTYWGERAEKVIYETEGQGKATEVVSDEVAFRKSALPDGSLRYYNDGGGDYRVDGDKVAVRPRRDGDDEGQGNMGTVWYQDVETNEVVAAVGEQYPVDDGEIARFEDAEAAQEGDKNAVPAYYEYNQSEGEFVVYNDGEKLHYPSKEELEASWVPFRGPFIPEARFPNWPDTDDFEIIIFPDSDNEEYDQPQLYHRGECTPLFDHLGVESVDDVDAGEIEAVGDVEDATSDEPTPEGESEDQPEEAEESESASTTLAVTVEGFEEAPTPARVAADDRLDLSAEEVADAAQGAFTPPKQQRIVMQTVVNSLATDGDHMVGAPDEAADAIVLPDEIEDENDTPPEGDGDDAEVHDDAEGPADTATDEQGDTGDADGSESDPLIGPSPMKPGLSVRGYREPPTPTQLASDGRVELTAEEIAEIARGNRELDGGNKGIALQLALNSIAKGTREFTPEEIPNEIIIPPGGVGAFATDDDETPVESEPVNEEATEQEPPEETPTAEPVDEPPEEPTTPAATTEDEPQAGDTATDTSRVTAEEVAADDRIDLSVGAIEAFADGAYTPTDQEEVDLQAVVRSLSDGGRREIQTIDDARNAVGTPEDEPSHEPDPPASPEVDTTETTVEQEQDVDEDWFGVMDAEMGSESSSVSVHDEGKDSYLMGNFGAESEDEDGK